MAAFIGIDLGTTYSMVSYLDDTGRPKIIRNSDGQNLTPSCIEFIDNEAQVGETARKGLGWNKNVVARFKRDMGTETKYKVGDKEYTPTDCSALILKKLLQDAQEAIGEIGEAVVTIPANFTNEARTETLTAAKLAGLNVKNIVNEPTAAAIYYVFQSGEEFSGHYAVYDLGGGTFDVSIIKVEKQDITVLSSEGVKKLGGDDFDIALQKIVKKKHKDATGEDTGEDIYTKTDAEEDKKSLSKRKEINVRIEKSNYKITREEFEQEISALIAQTEMLCESAIEEASLTLKDIKNVLLVGGSTRVPCVIESVKKVFKKDPVTTVNVDEAVVLGAALFSAYKGDQAKLTPVQKTSVNKMSVQDVTCGCFGVIAVRGPSHDEEFVVVLIKKNEKTPCTVTKSLYTVYDNQTGLDCRITQANDPTDDPKWVQIVWDGSLDLPSGRPANQQIDVTYSYDENSVMHASFVDVETGKETETSLSNLNPSSDSGGHDPDPNKPDIDKFIVD
jgi:molecular chaperone DnaK